MKPANLVLLSAVVAALVSGGSLAAQGGMQQQGGQQPAAAAQAAAPAGNAENGKKLFNSVGCYQCHGYSAQGGSAGARLAPNPMPFASLVKYVRAPRNAMPPYTEKVLSEAQLADIYAYLKTIPKGMDAKDIPLLNTQ